MGTLLRYFSLSRELYHVLPGTACWLQSKELWWPLQGPNQQLWNRKQQKHKRYCKGLWWGWSCCGFRFGFGSASQTAQMLVVWFRCILYLPCSNQGFQALHCKNEPASKKLVPLSCQLGAQPCSSPVLVPTGVKHLRDASGGCRTVLVGTAGVH